ncbi:putative HTH-type transcriptional regulator YwnA [Oxobacter pfennigii]|uniref:Putative HTH-type transcriptional regulator YwnA n=1 Tax=Oxobacter pfennigii TaxID=36849 RepID=A0A0P9AE47_9CLOT|nr:Rrf2 family transcriptional regulator [Oxobacter pfennigii]KPU43534.1 putative HTH-type transcriptional regulator YwnA [Oxobacter pfennigii]
MRVSTQFPIAFHALMMIACFKDTRVTSEMVAGSAGCNAVTIRNIFSKLKKADLLSVKAGTGGTALGKPAEDITLWDIYAAVESDSADEIFKIHSKTSGSCPIGSNVRGLLSPHLDSAVAAMKAELSKVTLGQLIDELNPTQQTV